MQSCENSSLSRNLYTSKSNGIVIEEDVSFEEFLSTHNEICTSDEGIEDYIRCHVEGSREEKHKLHDSISNPSQIYSIPPDFKYVDGGGPRYLTKRSYLKLSEGESSSIKKEIFIHETYRVDNFGTNRLATRCKSVGFCLPMIVGGRYFGLICLSAYPGMP